MPAEKNLIKTKHYHRSFWIEGETNDVIAMVHDELNRDYVCPMYEHMSLRIMEVDTSKLPFHLRVRMFKNLYAGD